MAKVIDLGEAPPDHPIYSTGFIIGGRRLGKSKKKSSKPQAAGEVKAEVLDEEKDKRED